MYVYVLRLEMYREWACENGACDLIGVYSSKETVLDKLKDLLLEEQNENHVIGIHDSIINKYLDGIENDNKDINSPIYIDIYQNLESYNNGFNEGCYVLEKVMIK